MIYLLITFIFFILFIFASYRIVYNLPKRNQRRNELDYGFYM